MQKENQKIGIVGPCSAGKSTLAEALKRRGYAVRHIAQEHSKVPDMWRRLGNPDCLIYLDVSYQVSMHRRPLNMSADEFSEQVKRLRNAFSEADLYIHTDALSPEEVLDKVENHLSE
jgi:deoxyadenosine/deoxycytidine kinase